MAGTAPVAPKVKAWTAAVTRRTRRHGLEAEILRLSLCFRSSPYKRTSGERDGMSEKCQTRTSNTLFDHLISAREQCNRDLKAKHLGGLEIDDEFVFIGLLHRQVARLFAV